MLKYLFLLVIMLNPFYAYGNEIKDKDDWVRVEKGGKYKGIKFTQTGKLIFDEVVLEEIPVSYVSDGSVDYASYLCFPRPPRIIGITSFKPVLMNVGRFMFLTKPKKRLMKPMLENMGLNIGSDGHQMINMLS